MRETDRDPIIVAARRTAIGRAGGLFRSRSAEQLAAPAIRAVLTDAGLAAGELDEVILGNALEGGNMARLAALAAGLPPELPAVTLDRQCTSGLDAVLEACWRVAAGQSQAVLAGGLESCSTAPWRLARPATPAGLPRVLSRARFSAGAYGDPDPVDGADALARAHGIARAEQDAWAARSHANAVAACEAGRFGPEIVPVFSDAQPERDESPKAGLTADRLARLRPLCGPQGSVTAGTTAPEADAAAVLLVMSRARQQSLGMTGGLELVDSARSGCDPAEAGFAAVPAIRALAARRGRGEWADLAQVEFNEAFAGQTLACLRAADLAKERVCPHGGALAFGHPFGASGALLVVRLFHDLQPEGLGLAAVSAMGGQGTAALFRACRPQTAKAA